MVLKCYRKLYKLFRLLYDLQENKSQRRKEDEISERDRNNVYIDGKGLIPKYNMKNILLNWNNATEGFSFLEET